MFLIDVPSLKEIEPWEDCFYEVQKRCEEEKCEENGTIFRSVYLAHN